MWTDKELDEALRNSEHQGKQWNAKVDVIAFVLIVVLMLAV